MTLAEAIQGALRAAVTADVGVYQGVAPEGATDTLRILWADEGGPDTNAVGGRAFTIHTIQVKASAQGEDAAAASLLLLNADAALEGVTLSIDSGDAFVRRSSILGTYPEVAGDVVWLHAPALYRIGVNA